MGDAAPAPQGGGMDEGRGTAAGVTGLGEGLLDERDGERGSGEEEGAIEGEGPV